MIKVSIIVPVYNTEKYLQDCLESISKQTFENFECIIVDDGSKDSSPIICDKFCKQDNRFNVIHKQNAGPAAARNTGLDVAVGQYICFADSDDYVHPQWLETLVQLIETNESVSAAFVDLQRFVDFKELTIKTNDLHNVVNDAKMYSKEQIFSDYVRLTNANHLFYGFMVTKIFKRNLFERIRFPEALICYEDVYIMVDYFSKSDSIITLELPLYYYRQNLESILHNNSSYLKKKIDYFRFIVHTADVVEQEGYTSEANKLRQIFVRSYLECLHHDYFDYKENIEMKRFICELRQLINHNWKKIKKNPLTTRMFMLCLFVNRFSVLLSTKLSKYLFDE